MDQEITRADRPIEVEVSALGVIQADEPAGGHESLSEPQTVILTTTPTSSPTFAPKSSVQHLSRRTLSTIPAAKPDGLWFQRDEPFHPRYTLPSDQDTAQGWRYFRLRQTLVSTLLTFFCYAFLLFALPTLALILWVIFRKQTGGVIPLPGENATNSTFGNDLESSLP